MSEHLTSPGVWEALLDDMPSTALIRNLATMTRIGLLTPGLGRRLVLAVEQLGNGERLRRARVHPIAVLSALRTYESGRGARGQGEWTPVREIVDALDAAFYAAFAGVEPAGTRLLLALDVSGSMQSGRVAGVPGLSPRDASAALALVTAATEPSWQIVGFYAGRDGWKVGEPSPTAVQRRRRHHAAHDQPATAADGRRAGGLEPPVRRDGLRPADAVRTGAEAGDRDVRDLHRLRDLVG